MASYVKGDTVENATSYELFEKVDGTYTSLAEASEINFEVSALGLASGDHVLVVKAKADGYADSNYSNEVTYTKPVEATDITSSVVWNNNGVIKAGDGSVTTGSGVMKYSDHVEISGATQVIMSFMTWTSSSGAQTSYGMAFYDESENFVSGYRFPIGNSGNSNGESYELTLDVPEGATTLRTTYVMDEETYGAFALKVVR